jgi:hypothetical protein
MAVLLNYGMDANQAATYTIVYGTLLSEEFNEKDGYKEFQSFPVGLCLLGSFET